MALQNSYPYHFLVLDRSVGCTVVEMLTTKPPLMEEDLDFCQRMFKIVNLDVQPPQDCSSLAYGFLTKCLWYVLIHI